MAKTARGCPSCGSHNTWGLGRSGIQQCDDCAYRWQPCSDQYCRGYRVYLAPSPGFIGCDECDAKQGGVKTAVVTGWPEAWRAVARKIETSTPANDTSRSTKSTNENGGSPEKAKSDADGASTGESVQAARL